MNNIVIIQSSISLQHNDNYEVKIANNMNNNNMPEIYCLISGYKIAKIYERIQIITP